MASALMLSGCDDLFDPAIENLQNDITQMYEDQEYMRGILHTVYSQVPGYYDNSEYATDDAVTNQPTNNFLLMATGGWTNSSYNPLSQWTNSYNAIQYINLFLESEEHVTWSSDEEMNELFKRRLTGEAYGLRGMFYFYLLQSHAGFDANNNLLGVPIYLKYLTSQSSTEDFNLPRATFQECVEQIESDFQRAEELLPFEKAGLNVVVDKDITKYRLRKVRILNGGHTSNVPAAFLSGLETVDEMMFDEVTGKFANEVIYNDIIPAVNLDKAMLTSFADDVVNRFKDKSMHHKLASILMNCTSKIKARVLSTVKVARAKGMLPNRLCFSLAAYLLLYKDTAGVPVQVKRANGKSGEFVDDEHAVSVLVKAWSLYQGTQDSAVAVADAVFSDTSLWGENIASDTPLMNEVGKLLHQAISTGVTATMRTLI